LRRLKKHVAKDLPDRIELYARRPKSAPPR
jgi:hypothetical protein